MHCTQIRILFVVIITHCLPGGGAARALLCSGSIYMIMTHSLPQAGAHVRLLEALSRAQAGGHAETVWRRCAARVAPRRSVVDHPSPACRRWRRCATRRRERVARSPAKPPPPFMSARLASGAAGQARSFFKQGTTRRRSAACRQLSFHGGGELSCQ